MLIDLRKAANAAPHEADTLVIGSGAVGLTLAIELVRAGRSVIVLEAGGEEVQAESQEFFKLARWRDTALPGLHLGRFRALGGTTNFWGGQLLRFDPIVFERRPWIADVGWPIGRQDLEAYYERGYELLGMRHRLADEMVWRRVDVAPPEFGEELEAVFSAWVPRANLAQLFRSEIASHADLRVVVNAPAVALELDEAGERVAAVVVRGAGGALHRFAGRRVVLANGTIEIARLLRLPLADGREAPWASNRWLGRGFAEHIDCRAGHATPIDKKRFHDLFDNAYLDGIKYAPKLKLAPQAQRKRQLLGIVGFFLFDSRLREHLDNARILARSLFRGRFQKTLVPKPGELVSAVRVAFPMIVRYLRHHRMYNPADQGATLHLMSEQLPLAESALHLSDKCDALGTPVAEIDWRIDGREVETLATFAEMIAQQVERQGLATIRLDPALLARDRSVLKQCRDYYHHMGMARMAETPAAGVVDRDLKLFGTRNLYVAGAAVFPTTGYANPTFTAIALGLRLAQAIAADRVGA